MPQSLDSLETSSIDVEKESLLDPGLVISATRRSAHRASNLPLWIHAIILAIYSTIFWLLASNHLHSTSEFNVLMENLPLREAFRFEKRVVGYNFEDPTPFNPTPFGTPNLDEVSQTWQELVNKPHELLLNQNLIDAAHVNYTVQLSDGSDKFLTQPTAYHMLHCLFAIHKYAHPDYYGEDPQGPGWVKRHTDHCVDNLRQFVQCHAGGSGVTSYRWKEGRKTPWGELSAEEVCIDWEYYNTWVQENSLAMHDLLNMEEKHILVHPDLGLVTYQDLRDGV